MIVWIAFAFLSKATFLEAAQCNGISKCMSSSSGCSPEVTTTNCGSCMDDPAITVTDVTVTQNGQSVDQNGGIDACQEFTIDVSGTNSHGAFANPRIKLQVDYCKQTSGGYFSRFFYRRRSSKKTCGWDDFFGNRFLGRHYVDTCDSEGTGITVDDCHLNMTSSHGQPSHLQISVNMPEHDFLRHVLYARSSWLSRALFNTKYHYLVEIHLFDGANEVGCVEATTRFMKTYCR